MSDARPLCSARPEGGQAVGKLLPQQRDKDTLITGSGSVTQHNGAVGGGGQEACAAQSQT